MIEDVRRAANRLANGGLRLVASRKDVGSGNQASQSQTTRVLFVCFGNICRSPLAEGILRARLIAAGLDASVAVDSAGTSDYNVGRPPDWRSRWCGWRRGTRIGDLRARQFQVDDFDNFNRIIVMDSQVMTDVLGMVRSDEDRGRVYPISRYTGGAEIADPVNGTLRDFERVSATLERACESLLKELESRAHNALLSVT